MCWVSLNMPRRLPAPAPCLHDPRRAPLTVGEVQIGAGRHRRLQRGHMPPAAATEDDGLDDGGPVHVFEVVQRRVGGNQLSHDSVVAQMRPSYERHAASPAGEVASACTQPPQDAQCGLIVRDGSDGDSTIAVVIDRIEIGTRGRQQLDQCVPPGKHHHVHWCASVTVPRDRCGTVLQEFGRSRQITPLRCPEQTVVSSCFRSRRGDLRQRSTRKTSTQNGAQEEPAPGRHQMCFV